VGYEGYSQDKDRVKKSVAANLCKILNSGGNRKENRCWESEAQHICAKFNLNSGDWKETEAGDQRWG
jgi:hypothetical protein